MQKDSEPERGRTLLRISNGRFVEPCGDLPHMELVGRRTHGARRFSLHLYSVQPHEGFWPRFHTDHEAAIHVLNGELTFRSGPFLSDVVVAGPGQSVFLPAQQDYVVQNTTSLPTKVVVVRMESDPSDLPAKRTMAVGS